MSSHNSNHDHIDPHNPTQAIHTVHDAVEAGVDPLGIATPLAHAQFAWLTHPQELAEALGRFSGDVLTLAWQSWQRALGMQGGEDVIKPNVDDTRFADRVWKDSATWDVVKQWYLLYTHTIENMLYDTPGLSGKERRRAAFWWRQWLNAVAPTSFFWSNPVAMRKFAETHGESLVRGYHNFIDDLRAGNVRMTNPDDFRVGKNLATTPGAVVFRNRLLEVIHYQATTEKVHRMPVVIVTPWINKFYILDLTPRKSLVKYLLDQGFSVFITSWKNPTADMRDIAFDDYLTEGVDQIVEVARAITGSDKVHAAGYCIGGTALAIYMAWANRKFGKPEEVPVAHWTLLTTLVDFRNPGDIEVFIDDGSIRYLTRAMAQRGYLDGNEMASAFRLLRSNSLIWHYVVHGWLYGETLPPFDVLYWNMDTTRMPYAMHAWYLRELYLHNNLVKHDGITLANQPIDLERIVQPLYAVAAEDDHIAPWRQTFRIAPLADCVTRYVLSSSGHILGIVNPPVDPPKRSYRVAKAERFEAADEWYARAEERKGSWWEDWMAWLKPQCGPLIEAPPLATEAFPALEHAPGSYVLEK